MKTPGTNYLMLRVALLIAPLATLDRAHAANNCNATSPVNNTIVTCMGATSDANGTTGYGTNTDNGNTDNILSGASVTGTVDGLVFNGGTVNNSGTISGGSRVGIQRTNDAVVNNSGTISANGADGIGISSFGIVNANNSGAITAGGANGLAIFAARATVTNSGFIGAEKIGIEGVAVSDVTNTSAGTITAVGPNGIGIFGDNSAKVDNAGQITATDATGIAIKAMAAERGLTSTAVKTDEYVSGTLVGSTQLASGRFAMIDDGIGFQLVPWQPVLDKRIGQHLTGAVRDAGGIEWNFSRKRGLGL
jgi:hypothetical protein